MNDKLKLIEYFYLEALKQDIGSEEFSKNAKHILTFYRETFGMTQIYLDYVDFLHKNKTNSILELLSNMKSELVKVN